MAQFIDKWWYLLTGGLVALGIVTWTGLTEAASKGALRAPVLSWVLVAAIAAGPFAIAAFESPATEALWDLYLAFLGAVLLFAFFQPDRTFVFLGFQRLSKTVFYFGSPRWLLAFGALFLGGAVYDMVRRYAV